MNIKTFNKVLLTILQAGLCPWVWGSHAKGKSEVIENFYKSRGWRIYNERLNTKSDVGDIIGLPAILRDKAGKETSSAFMIPEWLRELIAWCEANPDKRGCIFFDEVNRAGTPDIMGPLFQMSLDKRLNMTVFPKNLDIILASNPNTGDYTVLNIDDEALLSRFWHVDFNPSKNEWIDHMEATEEDPDVIGFITENKNLLEDDREKFSVSDLAKPDRRKWKSISKLRKGKGLEEDDQPEVFAGLVGMTTAIAFLKYLEKADKAISTEEILNEYNKVRPRLLKAKESGKTRTDIINTATNKIKDFFKDDPGVSEVQGANVVAFIKDLPNDQMFDVMHSIYRKRKFHDFCENNYEKLAMVEIEKRLEEIRRTVNPETLKNV